MKKVITILFISLFSTLLWAASAQWSTPGKITYMSIGQRNNYVYLQLSSPRVGGCAGRFYMINVVDEPMGQNMLSLLLSYEARGEDIMVYTNGTCITDYQNAVVEIVKTPGDNRSY